MSDDSDDTQRTAPTASHSSDSRSTSSAKNPTAKTTTRPQDVKPPAKPRAVKRSVTEPVSDTGYEEPIMGLPTGRGPREDDATISSRKRSPAYAPTNEVDSHYTDRSYVVQASAESSRSAQAEPESEATTIRPSIVQVRATQLA